MASGETQRRWLYAFNGATYQGSAMWTLLRNISLRDTTPLQLVRFFKGIMFSLASLEEEQTKVDLVSERIHLCIPVFFCCGRRDYNVPSELTVELARSITAPSVEVVWFERSGHLPNLEERAAFIAFCRRISALEASAPADPPSAMAR